MTRLEKSWKPSTVTERVFSTHDFYFTSFVRNVFKTLTGCTRKVRLDLGVMVGLKRIISTIINRSAEMNY